MSDHADTIRRYLLWKQALSVYDATQHKHLIDNDVPQPTIEEALEALDALLAELDQWKGCYDKLEARVRELEGELS